jgi:hypothetical protein
MVGKEPAVGIGKRPEKILVYGGKFLSGEKKTFGTFSTTATVI